MSRKEKLKNVKKIVVKVGTSSLTTNGSIDNEKITKLTDDLISLLVKKYQVILVSSGAVSAGCGEMKIDRSHLSVPQKQAMASIGQTVLMNNYRENFNAKKIEVGQLLLTEGDIKNRRRFLNARHAINTLLSYGVLPIINENDSVVVEELTVGDNDTLAVHVANMVQADLLIILSDVEGFFWDLSDEKPLSEVNKITTEIKNRAGGAGSVGGTGGMLTKINAANVVIRSGEKMIIANAQREHILTRLVAGEELGTLFIGDCSLSSRKRWIAFNMNPKGGLTIDDGAVKALIKNKKSLLATGLMEVEGNFKRGDAVNIKDKTGKLLAKGIVNYNSEDLDLIKGLKTLQIKKLLSNNFYEEVINRDYLIILL